MLDATKSRFPAVDETDESVHRNSWREDAGFSTFFEKVRQRQRMMMIAIMAGAIAGWVASLGYLALRVTAYSASSELLISNTTLQMSGPEAVVTQILVENSLIQSAIEVLISGRVLARVIDKVGLEEVARISPRSYALPWSRFSLEQGPSDARKKQAAIALLRSNTTVKRVGTSQIIEVGTRAITAADAARLTNDIAGAFVQELYDANAVVTTSAALRERIKVLGPTARIISEAIPPKSKDSPSFVITMLLGIVVGGALGATGSLVLLASDRRLRVAEQVAAVSSIECFGYVPRIGLQSPSEADHKLDPDSVYWRSVLRRVRSAVLQRSTSIPHIVGATSCRADEGKTTLATKLARFIACEGSRVLLIDASCSDETSGPAQAETPGLQELLLGTATLEDVILDEICPNLDFLPSGNGFGDLDLVWGNLVRAINGERERCYEWIILDLPVLSSAIDARCAIQIVDDLLIVVEWGRTSEGQLRQALRGLGSLRDRALGTVINRIPSDSLEPRPPSPTELASRLVSMIIDPRFRQPKNSHDEEKVS
jgi:Mrp family chromosome partitioning ATPase/capsular polysaccharide biosynthesis protein